HQIAVQRERINAQGKQVSGHRIHHAQWNVIVRKWCSIAFRIKLEGVIQLDTSICQKLREVTLPFGCGEQRDWTTGSRVVETLSLIVDEKEQFVLDDRTAKRYAKHVPAKRWLREILKIVGPVVSVENIVP